MKKLILYISLLIGLSIQAQVPNTTTFNFQNVQTEFVAHETGSWDDLDSCATYIIPANSPTNPSTGNTYWEDYPNSLYGFRGYSHSVSLLSGCLICLELDETSAGDAVDSYAGKNYTNNNATINQSGKVGASYLFNGSSSYLRRTGSPVNYLLPSTSMTISMWVYRLANSSSQDFGSLFNLWDDTDSEMATYIALNNADAATPNLLSYSTLDDGAVNDMIATYAPASDIWLNTWNHIVLVRDGADASIYLNGTYVDGATNGSGVAYTATSSLETVGAGYWFSSTLETFFEGKIDQVAMWNRVLTQSEITQLYNSGNGLAYINW
jgi:hypothetical protein